MLQKGYALLIRKKEIMNQQLPIYIVYFIVSILCHTNTHAYPNLYPHQLIISTNNNQTHYNELATNPPKSSKTARSYAQYITQQQWQQEQIRLHAQWTEQQFADEITSYLNQANIAGYTNNNAEYSILDLHHLYCLESFITCIKQLPLYRPYIHSLHQHMQQQKKGLIYRFKKQIGYLTLSYADFVEKVTQLHSELEHDERRAGITNEQQCSIVREMLEESDDIVLCQQEQIDIRISKRNEVLQKAQATPSTYTYHEYQLTDTTKKLLHESSRNSSPFESCYGTALQQQAHQEIVDILNVTAEYSKKIPCSALFSADILLNFTDISHSFNAQGHTVKAFAINDFCFALLDYGKAVMEGIGAGINGVVCNALNNPLQTAACLVAGEYVLAYQLANILYNVAEIGTLALIDPERGAQQWQEYIEPVNQVLDILEKKQFCLRDGIKGATALAVGLKTQSKLLGTLSSFYKGTKTNLLEFIKKNPKLAPKQYVATTEGSLLRVIEDAHEYKKESFVPLSQASNIGGKSKPSMMGLIKKHQLPWKGRIRYIPPKNWPTTQDLPRVKIPGKSAAFVDRFGNIWTSGESRTKGQLFEWDVQLSRSGIQQLGKFTRDKRHLNVSLDGRITHK